MKDYFKARIAPNIGIIVLAAVIVFSMSACGDDDENGGSGGGSALGATLNLSGKVFTGDWNETGVTYNEFTGNRTISASYLDENDRDIAIGGTGAITNGQLSFSIGTPSSLQNISGFFGSDFNNLRISNTAARVADLNLRVPNGSRVYRGNESTTLTRWESEEVLYMYVDRDVTVSADRKENTGTEDGFTWTETFNAFTINLKEGWNALHSRRVAVETDTSETFTMTISTGNPANLRWILNEWGGDDNGGE